MTRLALLPLAIAPFLFACTAGGDVYVESHNGSSQSSLACVVAPGEDLCARSFDGLITPERRPAVVPVLAAVAEFAGIAHEAQSDIARACEAIVEGLGVARPIPSPGVDEPTRVKATCDAAVLAIGSVNRSSFSLRVAAGTCVDVPRPSCAAEEIRPSIYCPAPSVTLAMNPTATVREASDGAVLQKNLASIANLKGRLEQMARLSAVITGRADALADAGACRVTAINLAVKGTTEVHASAELAAKLMSAIAPGP